MKTIGHALTLPENVQFLDIKDKKKGKHRKWLFFNLGPYSLIDYYSRLEMRILG